MKTYSEYFNNAGVVSLMFENNKTKAVNIFGELTNDDISLIDEYFDFRIGDCFIFSKIENKTPEKIASMLLLKYGNVWLKIKNNLGVVYSVAEPNKTTETTNATTNNETTSTNTRNNNNKVFGFDSSSGVDSNAETETSSGSGSNDTIVTTTKTVSGTGGREMSELIKNDNQFIKENIYIDLILDDIKSFVCLDIYEDCL